jgi:hypothetical protein
MVTMGLDTLLAALKHAPSPVAAALFVEPTGHSVTPVTAGTNLTLQRKPAWALACTSATSVTSKNGDGLKQSVAYQRHHFACPSCQAAGRGSSYGTRCSTGIALWRAYSDQE